MKETIKILLENKNKKSWVSMINRRLDLKNWVLNEYPNLPLNESLFLIVNDIEKPPLAPCGSKRKFENGDYTLYCQLPTKPSKNNESYCIECNKQWRLAKNSNTKKNNIEKYGVEHTFQRNDIKDKIKNTNIERYGVEHSSQIKGMSDRKKKIFIEKYGVDNPLKSDTIKNKIKKTNLEKYGTENAGANKNVVAKRESTMLDKYGVKNAMQSQEIRNKACSTNLKMYGCAYPLQNSDIKQKIIDTNIKKYGVPYASMNSEIHKKVVATNNVRYNVDYPLQNPIILEKTKNSIYKKFNSISAWGNSAYETKMLYQNSVRRYLKLELQYGTQYELLFDHTFMINKNHTFDYPFKCKKSGKEFSSGYNNPIKCPCCHEKMVSGAENDLSNYIESLGIEVLRNQRILNKKEIDILTPGTGFEYNGMFWHNSKTKDINYHQNKTLLCKEQSIKLIHIFEDEWLNKNEIIKERIKSVLGKSEKLYARKCKIKVLDNSICNEFLDNHHLQGKCNASVKLGLYHNDVVVAVMTFGKSRFNKNYEWELIRYCSKGTIIGGASKLLKYFEENYKPKSLISYADMNWSDGNLYKVLGFEYVGMTKPSYFYYDPKQKIRISRQQCQKHKLVKKGFDPSNTEEQICIEQLGYYKIYDSGNLIYHKYYN